MGTNSLFLWHLQGSFLVPPSLPLALCRLQFWRTVKTRPPFTAPPVLMILCLPQGKDQSFLFPDLDWLVIVCCVYCSTTYRIRSSKNFTPKFREITFMTGLIMT